MESPIEVFENQFDESVDQESRFCAKIVDGHTFRNLIEYFRGTNLHGNFRFNRAGIYYEQGNAGGDLVNQLQIFGSELIEYEYESRDEEIVIGATIADLRTITKPISKKDGIHIYKKPNDSFLYVEMLCDSERSGDNGNVATVRPNNIKIVEYTLPEFNDLYPNCKIRAAKFSKSCNSVSSIKCSHINMIGTSSGLIIKSVMENGIVGRVEHLGNTSDFNSLYSNGELILNNDINLRIVDDEEDEYGFKPTYITCKSSTIKSLSKLNNLCSKGLIKIYSNGKNLKLSCNIGNYGILNIYIDSVQSC